MHNYRVFTGVCWRLDTLKGRHVGPWHAKPSSHATSLHPYKRGKAFKGARLSACLLPVTSNQRTCALRSAPLAGEGKQVRSPTARHRTTSARMQGRCDAITTFVGQITNFGKQRTGHRPPALRPFHPTKRFTVDAKRASARSTTS